MLPSCLLTLLWFPRPSLHTPELRLEVALEPRYNHPFPFPFGPLLGLEVPAGCSKRGSQWRAAEPLSKRKITQSFLPPAPPGNQHTVSTQAWGQNFCVAGLPAPKLQFMRDLLERHGVAAGAWLQEPLDTSARNRRS